MSNKDVLSRLEYRAVEAQKLIQALKSEITTLKKLKYENCPDKECHYLMKENEKLAKEVEIWKERLIKAETNNGKIPVDGEKTDLVALNVTPLRNGNSEFKFENESPLKEEPKPTTKKGKINQEKPKTKKLSDNDSNPKMKKESCDKIDEKVDVGRLDFRIGRIETVEKHPDADSLYVESVNLGDEKRTVVSGLVRFVEKNDLEGRLVVLLCNLKPAKMRGVTSEAMVLCASTPEKVEVLSPPQGSIPGDIVIVDGFDHRPDPVLNPKKKIWETVATDLKVNCNGVATYKGVSLTVPGKGDVLATSLTDVPIK